MDVRACRIHTTALETVAVTISERALMEFSCTLSDVKTRTCVGLRRPCVAHWNNNFRYLERYRRFCEVNGGD
ncbi:hypothetical protein NC651_027771 [Populus alba x Populus x berolinensis]|nr:hypothetical protein NC651_027771 [Populus alba x Populus x berolinensis]